MSPGKAFIQGSLRGLLSLADPPQHLWFNKLQKGSRKEKVIPGSEERIGHQCIQCGAILIDKSKQSFAELH